MLLLISEPVHNSFGAESGYLVVLMCLFWVEQSTLIWRTLDLLHLIAEISLELIKIQLKLKQTQLSLFFHLSLMKFPH